MFNKPVNAKIVAFLITLPSFILFLGSLIGIILVPAFALTSGGSVWLIIPFLILALPLLVVSICGFVLAYMYFTGKPLSQNVKIGTFLVFFSLGFLIYALLSTAMSFIVGNQGGYMQIIFITLISMISLPVGLGMRNGYKEV